jgi:predicted Zn-dependent peptidase
MAGMLRRALVFLLPFLAHAQIADLAIDHSTLQNGMDLLLHTDHRAPFVHLNIRIRVGSKHEKPGQFGLAHLFEHLFYQDRDGTPFGTETERAVTVDEVNAAARKYARTDQAFFLLVGDREKIQPQLRDFR